MTYSIDLIFLSSGGYKSKVKVFIGLVPLGPAQGTQKPFLGGQKFRLLLFLGLQGIMGTALSEACRAAASSWTFLTSLRIVSQVLCRGGSPTLCHSPP